jgi:hypothetical protein
MGTAAVQDARHKRLQQLGEEFGLLIKPLPSPKPRPDYPPRYCTENDVSIAEELLRRRRVAQSENMSFKGGLSRAFMSKKTAWDYKEVYDALLTHVTDRGSPGVAEARKQLSEPFFLCEWGLFS